MRVKVVRWGWLWRFRVYVGEPHGGARGMEIAEDRADQNSQQKERLNQIGDEKRCG